MPRGGINLSVSPIAQVHNLLLTPCCPAITQDQRSMYSQIKKFVLEARKQRSTAADDAKVTFVNDFPARDRQFLIKIAEELKLVLTWDEYDDEDNNVATLRTPVPPPGAEDDSDDDIDGGEAGRSAVDRVLGKYARARVLEEQGDSEERYEAALKERMDEWKKDYYRVRRLSNHIVLF